MNASSNDNPDSNKNTSEANEAKGKAVRLQSYSPQSRHKCVDSEKLVGCASISLGPEFIRRRDDKGDQGNPESANLLEDALSCAIGPSRDNPVVSPPNIEYATHGLKNIEYEKGKLPPK